MSKKRAVFSALFLFICGAVFGAVSQHVAMRYRVFHTFRERPFSPVGAIVEGLSRELRLSVEQKEKVRPLVEDAHSKLEAVRREHQPEIDAVIDDAVKKAEPMLEPQQIARLHELQVFVKERFANPPRPPHGPPPGGPFDGPPPPPPFGDPGE